MEIRKGFTLIELLVTITIIGIIMLIVLPAITNLQRENQKKKFDDYERAVLEAAKAYEDQYEEDLFGRYSEGCAYIDFGSLVEKKLLTTTKISGYECNYDTNGIIIRKVKGKSFYEVYLDCVKGNETKKLTNNSGYKSISRDYCDVGEDKTSPTLEIKCDSDTINGVPGDDFNETRIYYYSATNEGEKKLPELTVKVADANSGLEKNQYVTYEWKIYTERKDQELNGNPNYTEKNRTTFNIKDGAGSTAKKKVRIVEEFKKEGSTGKAIVDLSGENIVDRAGNKLSLEVDTATNTCTYYYDNVKPQMNITITGASGTNYNPKGNAWIKESITTTVTITDQTANNIYSGIKTDTFKSDADKVAKLSEEPPTHTYTKPDDNREHLDEYTICDKVGNCTTDTANIKVDTTPPVCGKTSTSASTPWINKNRTVTVDCSDNLSGCTQDTYSKTFGEGTTDIITIRDNAGNTTDCPVYTKVDKTKPSCTSSGGNDHWINTPLTITGTCNDELSGCAQPTYTNNYSSEISITNGYGGRACDVAGNCADCSKDQDVHIDTTPPSCDFFEYKNQDTPGTNISMQVICLDDKALKRCGHDEVGYGPWNDNVHLKMIHSTFMDGAGTMVRDVVDQAGNKGQCTIHISVSRCTSTCCGTHKCHCDANGNNCSRCANTCTKAECCGYHVG